MAEDDRKNKYFDEYMNTLNQEQKLKLTVNFIKEEENETKKKSMKSKSTIIAVSCFVLGLLCGIVLCIVMFFYVLPRHDVYEIEKNPNHSLFKEKFSTSKEAYLKDIEHVMNLPVYLEYGGHDFDKIIEIMSAYLEYKGDDIDKLIKITNKKICIFTKEGNAVKDSAIKAMELAKEGLELKSNITMDNRENWEEMLEQVGKLEKELDELLLKVTEQVDDFRFAATNVGVEAEDIQDLRTRFRFLK